MFKRVSFLSLSAAILLTVSSNAKVVTETAAQKIAKDFMTSNGLAQKELLLFESNGISPALRAPSFDSPAYHIFKDAKSNDFIVVSGDDIARPILGYSFGNKTSVDGEIPPSLKEWLDNMEKQILHARRNGLSQSAEIARQWGDPGIGNVVIQLNTAKWNQYAPYNMQCPIKEGDRCLTGCTATSIAILMKYYGFPSAGKGVTPSYTCVKSGVHVESRNLNHPYYWDSMPLEYDDYTWEQGDSVAQLMADIGAAIQADYSPETTSAYYNKGPLYKHFGIFMGGRKNKTDYSNDDWNTMLRNSLDNHRPVLYSGRSSEGMGGHSFVIDGYTDQDYFCVNWGWGGQYDGAYALDALDLSWIDFKDDQAAFFDFQEAVDTLPVVAIVSDTIECPSLASAFGMVPYNGDVTNVKIVMNNIIDEAFVQNYQNVVLNLNGFNVEVENYGIINYGKLLITDSIGNGKMTANMGNHEILCNYGELTVEGGEFSNQTVKPASGNDYRRCIWSDAGSNTCIKSGKFICEGQVICMNGKLTIEDGDFESKGNSSVISNYAQSDTLCINGGSFKNLSNADGGSNNRRSIWTSASTITILRGGQFKSANQVVCSNGKLTIDSGNFETTGNASVISNYATDSLIINGGTFKNTLTSKPESNDYRRALWSAKGSITQINGGDFKSTYQVLCSNGKLTIDSGLFETNGNESVVSNYATDSLIINGGTFKNTLTTKTESIDYRRALWSEKGSITQINDGYFSSDYQVVTFNGKATINGGTIVNIGNGEGCRSAGNVVINDCKLQAKTLLYLFNGSSLKCYGGLYSQTVSNNFIGSGYRCVSNNDNATKATYPYKIEKTPTSIHTITDQKGMNELHYDLNGGIRSNNNEPGIHIIRKADGKTEKVLYK